MRLGLKIEGQQNAFVLSPGLSLTPRAAGQGAQGERDKPQHSGVCRQPTLRPD